MTAPKEQPQRSLLRQLGFAAEAVCVIPLGNMASRLPWRLGRSAAACAGRLAYRLAVHGRQQASRNLDIIFSDIPLTEAEKDRIIRRLFVHVSLSAFEYLKSAAFTASNYRHFLEVENLGAFHRALAEGRGVLAVSAHVGNWEVMANIGAKMGWNIAAVIHRQLNPYTDRWLREIREQQARVKCLYDDLAGMRGIAGHLRQNGILAILADERHSRRPITVPFFGRPAATADGPAKLHLLHGSPIIYLFALRQPDGRYLVQIDGPHDYPRTGNMRLDCLSVMRRINERYEAVIRRHPDQWFSLLTPRWKP